MYGVSETLLALIMNSVVLGNGENSEVTEIKKGPQEIAQLMLKQSQEKEDIVFDSEKCRVALSVECKRFKPYKIADNSNKLTPPSNTTLKAVNLSSYNPIKSYFGHIKGSSLINFTKEYTKKGYELKKIASSILQIGKLFEFLNNDENDLGIGKDEFKEMLDINLEDGLDYNRLKNIDDIDTTEIEPETLRSYFKHNFISKSNRLLATIKSNQAIIKEEHTKQEKAKIGQNLAKKGMKYLEQIDTILGD